MELAALTPTDKKESIETAFMELEDMEQILLEEPRFAVSTIQDVRPVAKRLEMEASPQYRWITSVKSCPSGDTWAQGFLRQLGKCPSGKAQSPLWQLGGSSLAYKVGFKLSTKEALSSLLPVKNWPKSVAESRKMNTRLERFYKTCWKARPIC